MRFLLISAFVAVIVMLGGCDRAVAPDEQAAEVQTNDQTAAAPHARPADAPPAKAAVPSKAVGAAGDLSLTTKAGQTAELTRDYAGEPVPDVQFTGADGRKLSLTEYTGRPLLMNVWATWCAPCKHEMPALDKLAEMEAGQMSVVAISQDIKGRRPVREFFQSAGIVNLEGHNDPKNLISKALAPALPLPATVLYDSDGREVWRVIGAVDWDSEEIALLLDEAG